MNLNKLLRLALFLVSFQMEVRVRASGSLLQQPDNCAKGQSGVCAVQVAGSPFHLIKENLRLHAPEGSTLMRLDSGSWRLIEGTLWVEKASSVEFETPYATVQAPAGQFWLIQKDKKLVIRNIDADISVMLADGKRLEVPAGFEFWVSGINSKGQNEFGMIQPIVLKQHLQLWGSLYLGGRRKFSDEVKTLYKSWGDLVEKSNHIYRQERDRKVANATLANNKKIEVKNAEVERRQREQKIFYQRTFER